MCDPLSLRNTFYSLRRVKYYFESLFDTENSFDMHDIHFKKMETMADRECCYSIIHELRTHLTFDDFIYLTNEAKLHDGYTLIGCFENDECLGVMGYRILFDLVHGKHFYIDDLVVTEKSRSKGNGAKILAYSEVLAKENGCKNLRLCTGVDNSAAGKFYEKNKWDLKAIVYKKKL